MKLICQICSNFGAMIDDAIIAEFEECEMCRPVKPEKFTSTLPGGGPAFWGTDWETARCPRCNARPFGWEENGDIDSTHPDRLFVLDDDGNPGYYVLPKISKAHIDKMQAARKHNKKGK